MFRHFKNHLQRAVLYNRFARFCLLAYFSFIFLFAFIYWLEFERSTYSFIYLKEINVTIDERYGTGVRQRTYERPEAQFELLQFQLDSLAEARGRHEQALSQLRQLISRADSLRTSHADSVQWLTHRIDRLSHQIRETTQRFHYFRRRQLQFLDFLYFSVITATTTGFGDIVPNSTTVRFLVSLQVICSLGLYGLFFYFVAEKVKEE